MRVEGSGMRVQGLGFRVQGAGFRVQGTGFRVQGGGSQNTVEWVGNTLGRVFRTLCGRVDRRGLSRHTWCVCEDRVLDGPASGKKDSKGGP